MKKKKFLKKDANEKIIEQQSKLTFCGIHKSYTFFDRYTFKQNEIFMAKPIYLGFTILKVSKLLMYETYYDKLQTYFKQEERQLHYMDTDSFVFSVNTKNFNKELKNLEDLFDFSNLTETHDLFSYKNKKFVGKFKIETPKKIWIDEFICLRSKMYTFNCGDDSKNKLKGISKKQSKKIKFEEFYNCLFGGKYKQECDNHLFRSLNHEMYLQRVRKSTLSQIDDKRCYINNIESTLWR